MADVKVPGVGSLPKPVVVLGVVVGLGGAWLVYRRQKSTASAAVAAGQASTTAGGVVPSGEIGGNPYPPDGTVGNPADPYSTDPNTGETYGDENSGYGGGVGYPPGYDTGAGGGGYYPTGPTGTGTSSSPQTPQQWADAVESALPALGFSSHAVAAALGRYLAGLTLDANQAEIIRAALAEIPYPGTAPPVRTSQPKGTGGGGTGWYWHDMGKSGYFTDDSHPASHASGAVTIGGLHYFWHADKLSFTRNGRPAANPPSGAANWG